MRPGRGEVVLAEGYAGDDESVGVVGFLVGALLFASSGGHLGWDVYDVGSVVHQSNGQGSPVASCSFDPDLGGLVLGEPGGGLGVAGFGVDEGAGGDLLACLVDYAGC